MKNLFLHLLVFLVVSISSLLLLYIYGKPLWYPYYKKYSYREENRTIECKDKIIKKIIKVEEKECPPIPPPKKIDKILTPIEKLKQHLADADFILYPKNLTLIALKYEKELEVWGEYKGKNIYITTYPFTAFSGHLGPKLREGDRQIPEGIYGVGYLNPNSKFNLSINIDYPNKFDKKMAQKENRTNLGSAIMIHGSNQTVGCIPIGDDNIEELYYLVERVGILNTKVIIAPIDFRNREVKIGETKHKWVRKLYNKITKEMKKFKK